VRFALVLLVTVASTTAHADEVTEIVDEADVRAAAGDTRGALERYQKALAIDPDRLEIYDKAVPLWIESEAWANAAAWLEKATLREPSYASGWYALGYVYRRTGRVTAAVLAYQEFVALRPRDAAGHWGLAISEELADDPAAVRSYRRYLALETDPERAAYRAKAREAIERLTPAPATWSEALRAIATGRATRAAWARFTVSSASAAE
jgi:tetratricopeptide (TPR) repeat protein